MTAQLVNLRQAKRNLDLFIEKHNITSYEELVLRREQTIDEVLIKGICHPEPTPYTEVKIRMATSQRRLPWWLERRNKRKQSKAQKIQL
jgi:hypothetical protein